MNEQHKAEGGHFFNVATKPASPVVELDGGRPVDLCGVLVQSPSLRGSRRGAVASLASSTPPSDDLTRPRAQDWASGN